MRFFFALLRLDQTPSMKANLWFRGIDLYPGVEDGNLTLRDSQLSERHQSVMDVRPQSDIFSEEQLSGTIRGENEIVERTSS